MNTRHTTHASVRRRRPRRAALTLALLFVALASSNAAQVFAQAAAAATPTPAPAKATTMTPMPTPKPMPVATPASVAVAAASSQTRSPSDVVREFYKAMREKRFREAFALSVFRPAFESLSAEEFAELRPNFERSAGDVPEQIEIGGEQISGDEATVFMRPDPGSASSKVEQVALVRDGGAWVVGDPTVREAVKRQGKKLFFEERIETHHKEVEEVLKEVAKAQFVHAAKNGGTYGELRALVAEKLLPPDVLLDEWAGYRYHVTLGKNRKTYTAGAEPVRHGRTGRRSFILEDSGIRSEDNGGKPVKPKKK